MNGVQLDSKIWWLIGLALAGIYSLLAVNLSISLDAVNAAHQAQRAAERSRPNPYTSIDSERDKRSHIERHMAESLQLTRYADQGDKLTKAELMLVIKTLDIPPKEVKDGMLALSIRISNMEKQVNRVEGIIDHKDSK